MSQNIIRDIAIDQNQKTVIASFNNSKIAVIDIANLGFGNKKPNVLITPNDSGAMPLYKSTITTTKITIRCQNNWIGSFDLTITKNY